jgi:signal peptidase I
MKSLIAIVGITFLSPLLALIVLITTRLFVETRYIPSTAMQPTLQVNDRVLLEKTKTTFNRPFLRGDILVFYPPPLEMDGQDLRNDPLTILGRLTGLPFLPYETAFIKRVIGLPGDRIQIKRNVGVFLNGKLLNEAAYVMDSPNYDLAVLSDIGGRSSNGAPIRPFNENKDAIIVPPGHLFMLGDNRNNSEDSHVWGFLDRRRVIGRACGTYWRRLEAPIYPLILDANRTTER